ncbi:MAG: phosphoesterase [Thermaceae bacterium]|nr:phosphoesterase [Thermaceae bacterium]
MRKPYRWLSSILLAGSLVGGLLWATTQAQTQAADPALAPVQIDPAQEPALSPDQEIALLRQKVKYVFVLYQENRSFDSYFGTFPGAEGLFSHPAAQTPGFYQPIINTDGSVGSIHPFRIGPAQYAADTDDIDHSHSRIVSKMDLLGDTSLMDRFALTEELKYSPKGLPSLKAKQFGELAMAYEDCDTIPILWRYANRFVLFDHIFQQMTGPSTPGNLSIIAAQTGATQWVKHPDQAYKGNGDSGQGVPVLNDADPFWGSQLDPTPQAQKMPVNPGDFRGNPPKEYATQSNLTFASLPMTLEGANLPNVTQQDKDPQGDLDDVKNDVAAIGASGKSTVPWGWYEEGYNQETAVGGADPVDAQGQHASYITHHNGPQYFGYIANNPQMQSHLQGLNDLFKALDQKTLPSQGDVVYVKGGSKNILGLKPLNPDPTVQKNFLGDDDHPAYSDAQISEALLATVINKIAQSGYWNQSAILITWDDSEGDYDHVVPPVLSRGPDGVVISDGPRVPLIVLSPYAKAHAISHETGDHASVVKFVDTLYNLTPLAQLPDELAAREQGKKLYGQDNLGPVDALTPGIGDLLSAFDPARLSGQAAPLPASYVQIPQSMISSFPSTDGQGCAAVGITPTDRLMGLQNDIPADFNPRPQTNPSR